MACPVCKGVYCLLGEVIPAHMALQEENPCAGRAMQPIERPPCAEDAVGCGTTSVVVPDRLYHGSGDTAKRKMDRIARGLPLLPISA